MDRYSQSSPGAQEESATKSGGSALSQTIERKLALGDAVIAALRAGEISPASAQALLNEFDIWGDAEFAASAVLMGLVPAERAEALAAQWRRERCSKA